MISTPPVRRARRLVPMPCGFKDAPGNIATEDLVHLCNELGVETRGSDLERLPPTWPTRRRRKSSGIRLPGQGSCAGGPPRFVPQEGRRAAAVTGPTHTPDIRGTTGQAAWFLACPLEREHTLRRFVPGDHGHRSAVTSTPPMRPAQKFGGLVAPPLYPVHAFSPSGRRARTRWRCLPDGSRRGTASAGQRRRVSSG